MPKYASSKDGPLNSTERYLTVELISLLFNSPPKYIMHKNIIRKKWTFTKYYYFLYVTRIKSVCQPLKECLGKVFSKLPFSYVVGYPDMA